MGVGGLIVGQLNAERAEPRSSHSGTGERLRLYRANFYVKMICEFHRAERTIKRDGGAILQVRLHEDHIGTLARGNLSQRIDRSGSNTLRR